MDVKYTVTCTAQLKDRAPEPETPASITGDYAEIPELEFTSGKSRTQRFSQQTNSSCDHLRQSLTDENSYDEAFYSADDSIDGGQCAHVELSKSQHFCFPENTEHIYKTCGNFRSTEREGRDVGVNGVDGERFIYPTSGVKVSNSTVMGLPIVKNDGLPNIPKERLRSDVFADTGPMFPHVNFRFSGIEEISGLPTEAKENTRDINMEAEDTQKAELEQMLWEMELYSIRNPENELSDGNHPSYS